MANFQHTSAGVDSRAFRVPTSMEAHGIPSGLRHLFWLLMISSFFIPFWFFFFCRHSWNHNFTRNGYILIKNKCVKESGLPIHISSWVSVMCGPRPMDQHPPAFSTAVLAMMGTFISTWHSRGCF